MGSSTDDQATGLQPSQDNSNDNTGHLSLSTGTDADTSSQDQYLIGPGNGSAGYGSGGSGSGGNPADMFRTLHAQTPDWLVDDLPGQRQKDTPSSSTINSENMPQVYLNPPQTQSNTDENDVGGNNNYSRANTNKKANTGLTFGTNTTQPGNAAFNTGDVSIGNPGGNDDATIDGGKFRLNGLPSKLQQPALTPPVHPGKIAVKLHHDYAVLSNAVYNDDGGVKDGLLPKDYEVVAPETLKALGLSPSLFRDDGSGFFSMLYKNKVTGKYVLAFRGTEPRTFMDTREGHGDIYDDASQGLGHGSTQYNQAINLARLVNRMVGSGNVTYTGHSLGGGLAAAASLVNQNPAVTFNAPAVHSSTLAPYGANDRNAQRLITSYVTPGELVGDLQGLGSSPFGKIVKGLGWGTPPGNTQGNQIVIDHKSDNRLNPLVSVNRHLMDQFLDDSP